MITVILILILISDECYCHHTVSSYEGFSFPQFTCMCFLLTGNLASVLLLVPVPLRLYALTI
jgi:hypothetical protein